MPKKKRRAVFIYKTERSRLDMVFEKAEERRLSAFQMLDRIIDDWCYGRVEPPSNNDEEDKPWYLR